MRGGNHLEPSVASWANEEIERLSGGDAFMWEPTEAYRKEGLGVASSTDRIIELSEPLHLTSMMVVNLPSWVRVSLKSKLISITTMTKQEWIIQVLHQMFCADLSWAIIVCVRRKASSVPGRMGCLHGKHNG